MKPISRFLLLSGVVLSLSACSTMPDVDMNGVAMMNQHLAQPFYVNAASVSVENRYNPMSDPKDVSSTLPTALDKAIRDYAEKRFSAAGSQGTFHFVIEDASVFQEDLPPTVKMGEFLGMGNQTRYTANIKANIYRDGASGVGPQGYEMKFERTVTMQSDVSLHDRDERLTAFITDLLNDIDKSATDKINNVLMLGAVKSDLAPSPGPYPPTPVEQQELQ